MRSLDMCRTQQTDFVTQEQAITATRTEALRAADDARDTAIRVAEAKRTAAMRRAQDHYALHMDRLIARKESLARDTARLEAQEAERRETAGPFALVQLGNYYTKAGTWMWKPAEDEVAWFAYRATAQRQAAGYPGATVQPHADADRVLAVRRAAPDVPSQKPAWYDEEARKIASGE